MPTNETRQPLPEGAVIDFCGETATIVEDIGGDNRLTVDCEGSHQKWYWTFEGVSCTVVSLPEHVTQQAGPALATKKTTTITSISPADDNHQVVTVKGGSGAYRKKPCKNCPWKKDAVGELPAEALRHSANTAHDMSQHFFGCHQSSTSKPATCAGFLLRGANHNLAVRMARVTGKYQDDVTDGGHALHDCYRVMAMANGVDADDPALAQCRD